MTRLPPPNRDRAVAILLFCALCGVLLGLGARALRQRRPVPVPRSVAVADLGVRAVPDLRLPGGGIPDAGVPTAPPAGERALSVLVLDARGLPVVGAAVVARWELSLSELLTAPAAALSARPPPKSATASPQPIGELGVLSGPLPFPEDIIAGAVLPPGAVQRGSSGAAGLHATTDSKGLARLVPVTAGLWQLLVNHDSKSAAAEVVVPATALPESGALQLVLRLGALPDALCTLPVDSGDQPPEPAPGEGSEVAGRVEDARGFPVSGARLELTSGRVRTQTLSDPRGAFAVRGLPAGALTVQVRHQGFAPLTLNQAADKPRQELRLTLHPGGGVSGLVREARVGGVPAGTQLLAESDGGGRQSIALGADGHFVATGLVPGALTLRARAPGYAPLSLTVTVPAGETPEQITVHDLRLELSRSATLRGRVRGPDGLAAGVAVSVSTAAEPGHPIAQLLTDARGEFVATDLPAGKLRLKATTATTSATADLELTAGDSQHTELELR